MQSSMMIFFSAALTAMAVENAVFARALGLGRDAMFMNSPAAGILLGATLTWVTTCSSLLIAAANYLLEGNPYILIFRPLAYLAGVAAIYVATALAASRWLKSGLADRIKKLLPVATFNTAAFGAFYISASQNFDFLQTTGYALGAGLGYTAAILVIYYARKRLAISPVPRALRGMPILLIYLGLISLAIYGIIGHSLAT